MKKLSLFLLSAVLVLVLAGCGFRKNTIEAHTWQLCYVQATAGGEVVAYSPLTSPDVGEMFPSASAVELICIAKDGELLILEKDGGSYSGTYKEESRNSNGVNYSLYISGRRANAVASFTSKKYGKKTPTLVITTEDHALYFQA